MLIDCPYCGPRTLPNSTSMARPIARPAVDGDLDGEATRVAFVEAVYLRDNPGWPPYANIGFMPPDARAGSLVVRDTPHP